MIELRSAGQPLEHVVGWAEFFGLRVGVDAGVFVPRRRTELLVQEALAVAPSAPVVLDLCCGTGAIGLALMTRLPGVVLHAVDIDPAAVRCASRNLAASGGIVHEGDLYEALPDELRGRVDLIVASAPYVPSNAIGLLPAEARLHESTVALDGGADGLDVIRRIIGGAAEWQRPAGLMVLEMSADEAPAAITALAAAGSTARVVRSEEMDATVVVGIRQAARC